MLGALELSPSAPPLLLLSSLTASRPHLSDYANSKFEGEQLLHGKPELPWTIIRPSAVYGPGDKEMLPLLKMIRRGLLVQTGPREQRLSLLHVDDLVDAIISWLPASQQCLHRTYSIDDGTAGGYSWDAIGDAVSDSNYRILKLPRLLLNLTARANLTLSSLFSYMPMLTPGKVDELTEPEWLCDNSDFTLASGWKPGLDLRKGAQQLFAETGRSSAH
jgi:nucleoside-diphosphate-sugar epimerase